MRTGRCPTCGRGEPRTVEQNDLLWPTMRAISKQVDWYGQRLDEYEWKDVLTASLKRQKVVPGIDGGFVVLGTSTRRLTKGEMSDLIDLALAFGTERGVIFKETETL